MVNDKLIEYTREVIINKNCITGYTSIRAKFTFGTTGFNEKPVVRKIF